jgi:predicted metal-dependent HD superfamily phosphohydrolase
MKELIGSQIISGTRTKEEHNLFFIRGIRSSADYEYEKTLELWNDEVCKSVETVYFNCNDSSISKLSSSSIKSLILADDSWFRFVAKSVPVETLQAIAQYAMNKIGAVDFTSSFDSYCKSIQYKYPFVAAIAKVIENNFYTFSGKVPIQTISHKIKKDLDIYAKRGINKYHGITHIAYMINMYHIMTSNKPLDEKFKPSRKDIMMYLAIIYHDIVYDPYCATKGLNEQKSYEYFRDSVIPILSKNYTIDELELRELELEIKEAILLTTHSFEENEFGDREYRSARPFAEFLCDLDLIHFAMTPRDRWKSLDKKVKNEYPEISDEVFAENRQKFLRKFFYDRQYTYVYYDKALNSLFWEYLYQVFLPGISVSGVSS